MVSKMRPGFKDESLAGAGGAPDEQTRRIFFAIDLPDELTTRAENVISGFGVPSGQVRWARAGNMHITMRFLGDVSEKAIPGLCDAAGQIAATFRPFRITVEGLGVFPNQERPRVVWFGVGGDVENLKNIETALSARLEGMGFPPEERAFSAHLTIGRVKSDNARGKIARLVRQYRRYYIGDAPVTEIALYESKLNPQGSIYTKLGSFKLLKAAKP
ncbi:MAG: RNA 2',3'-cyclic phosphodiesterase [Nitrospinae bacterium]|nr:RNA 2',3'-cyclic phosphodiesterase [Nitrospinota bacterium]